MIPKTIHYCWFGGKELPSLEKKCLESWIRILPDYKIKRWDESNFDVNQYPFAAEALKNKKYAFVADVCRLHALYTEGGIYLDTDVEMLRPLGDLHNSPVFMGFETDNVIQTGVIGAERENLIISSMLDYYRNKNGFNPDIDGAIANSELFANMFRNMGIPLSNENYQSTELLLLKSEYLCPINQATWEITATKNSYCIHYLSGSWLPKRNIYTRKLKNIIGRCFGYGFVEKLRALLR